MPAIPPSEESSEDVSNAESTAKSQTPAAPRTVNRRIPRTMVKSAPAAEVAPEVAAEAATASEAENAPEVAAGAVAESTTASSAATATLAASTTEPGPAESASEAAASAPTEANETAPPVSQRTGRIEIPVPSVVRARERAEIAAQNPVILQAESLTKSYGQVLAAADVSFEVRAGSLTGVVGPNGAGKTTVLSMITGLNRPTSGRISVRDIDVWRNGPEAKRVIGSLPDRLRLFDRLTGGQLLYYAGVLHGLDQATVAKRAAELAAAFGLESALDRPVSDYSAGMQKKIGLACSMIHAPEVLVLDEPYETIDPVSASNVTEILEKYVAGGGSVIMSSHSLDLIQRICDHVVVIVDGSVVAKGTVDEVRDGVSLEERFKHLTNSKNEGEGLEWLRGSSDSE